MLQHEDPDALFVACRTCRAGAAQVDRVLAQRLEVVGLSGGRDLAALVPVSLGSELTHRHAWCLNHVCVPDGAERIEVNVRVLGERGPDTDPPRSGTTRSEISTSIQPQCRLAVIEAMSRARYPVKRWQPAWRPGPLPLLHVVPTKLLGGWHPGIRVTLVWFTHILHSVPDAQKSAARREAVLLVFEPVAGKLAGEGKTWRDRVHEAKQHIEFTEKGAR